MNKSQTIRIWVKTLKNLRMLYTLTGKSMVSILDKLVTRELERTQEIELAGAVLSKTYTGQQVHKSVLTAIVEWLGDSDTVRSDSETVESLAADWIEVAHRES